MQALIPCSFCHKIFPESELHNCVAKAYSILNTLAEDHKDPNTIFKNIDNIVLQGGGVKGVSYLGVLEQLLEENENFLKDLKRVAGNSAGSIAALYIALNLDPKTDMAELMSRNYLDLLDDGLALRVAVNITSWFGDYKYKNYRVKDIFIAAINGFDNLKELMKTPSGSQQVQQISQEMFKNILQYYSSKLGKAYSVFMRAGAASFAESAAKWLITLLAPKAEEKPTYKNKIRGGMKSELPKNSIPKPDEELDNDDENKEPKFNFEEMLREAFRKVAEEAKVTGGVDISVDRNVETEENKLRNAIRPTNVSFLAMPNAATTSTNTANISESDKDFAQVKDDDVKFYQSQKQQPVADIADKSDLTGAILHYSLAELLWFIVVSQMGADGLKEEFGLFSGEIVKQELIENSIKMAFTNLKRLDEYKPGLTFKELYDFTDKKGNKLFKPLFATSFNTANLRTEVFSVYHTPNVVVSDAIRASMSIPIFFTPVTIRENGEPRRIYYNDGKDSEIIRYMDGGVLDNYPIWLFDDLKYCLDDIPEWVAKKKIFIHNPRTLGLRLLENRMIDIYTNPYYDEKRTQMKRVGTGSYESTFSFIMGGFLQANVNQHEENEHIYRGDCPRSIYVDSLGISTFAFSLAPEDKERLIKSGKQSIQNYKIRAQTNFIGEGENYH